MPKGNQTTRFSVSLPDELLAELDRRVVNRGYASRSELVRDLIREILVEDRWRDDAAQVFGVLTIVYDHHEKDVATRIIHAQHSRQINILCSTHVHIDHRNCLETIIIRGTPPEIRDAALEIGGLRGVQFSGLTRAARVDSNRARRSKRRSR